MRQKDFVFNLCLLIFLNLLVKPFWMLGIDVGVQNSVGAASYGIYFSIFNFTMLFSMVLDMGTTNFNNRTIARNNNLLDKHLSGYIALRLLLAVAYFVVIFAAALLIGYRGFQLELLFWIGLNQFLNAFLLYVRSNISALLMFKTDSVISVTDKLLMILFCGMLLWGNVTDEPFRIEWFVWCQTLAYLITIAVALTIVLRKAKLRRLMWDGPFFWLIIKKSFPYALITLLMASYYRIDSVLLERLLPRDIAATQAGIYATAFRLLDTLVMIAYLFSVILLPLFSKMLKQKENVVPVVRTSFSLLFLYSVSAVVILYVYREPLIQFFYPETMESSVAVFRLILFGLIPISMNYLFGTLLTANGSMKVLNITAAVGIVINVVVNLLLIPRMQACGSAVASFCTQFTVSVLQFVLAMRIIGIPLRSLPWLQCALFLLVLVPVAWFAPSILHINMLWQLAILTVFAVALAFATGLLRVREMKDIRM
ncbi:MAG: polysaccharide biosynthesis C-terminal domain-containing protein [Bacteroidales bacterium]|nr:polysaccharide biosynthesis C-terminal domain-containing protein [Bacteroidales bacterium]